MIANPAIAICSKGVEVVVVLVVVAVVVVVVVNV